MARKPRISISLRLNPANSFHRELLEALRESDNIAGDLCRLAYQGLILQKTTTIGLFRKRTRATVTPKASNNKSSKTINRIKGAQVEVTQVISTTVPEVVGQTVDVLPAATLISAGRTATPIPRMSGEMVNEDVY